MPISSHCFCPCESRPASRWRCSPRRISPRQLVDAVALLASGARRAGWPRLIYRFQGDFRFSAGHRLEHRWFLEFAANANLGDGRFVQPGEVDGLAENAVPASGRVFAGDDVHHGGFAGAIGADDAAQFAHGDVQGEFVRRPKAVKLTVMSSRYKISPWRVSQLAGVHQAAQAGGLPPSQSLRQCGGVGAAGSWKLLCG